MQQQIDFSMDISVIKLKAWQFYYHLDNIFIRFGSKLYRQIAGIPMGTNLIFSLTNKKGMGV